MKDPKGSFHYGLYLGASINAWMMLGMAISTFYYHDNEVGLSLLLLVAAALWQLTLRNKNEVKSVYSIGYALNVIFGATGLLWTTGLITGFSDVMASQSFDATLWTNSLRYYAACAIIPVFTAIGYKLFNSPS